MPADNAIKRALATGAALKGVHLTFPAPQVVEILGRVGMDFVYFDGEHGTFNRDNLENCCAMAEKEGMTAIARVPENSVAAITQFLDAGVRGIIVPHVESVEAGRAAVEATYFAPLGLRSFGAGRPEHGVAVGDMPTFIKGLNEGVSLSLMIESKAGLDVVGELAALDGVDYLSFGLMDLAQSLGHVGEPGHPEVKAAVAEGSEKIRAAGKRVREDFIQFAWLRDIIATGAKTTFDA